MEETGHRVSVSMPSLDATDDFPSTNTEELPPATDSVFSSTTFESTTVAVPEIALDETTTATCEENPFLNTDILEDEPLKDEKPKEDDPQPSIEADADDLIAAETSETLIDAPAEALYESQGDEDPSIAIEQFIKKITDEQLSSKRIEERQEEEAQEKEEPMASETSLDESALVSEDPSTDQIEEHDMTQEQEQEDKNEEAVKSTEINEEIKEPELMDIDEEPQKTLDKVVAEAVEGNDDDDDEHMAESIEEIQKEINKIPPKKILAKEESKNGKEEANNGICEIEKDIDDIMEGVSQKENIGNILKVALNKEQKLPTAGDSADVAKNPVLIENAKEEISRLDILICGDCHSPFYFNQELIEHKKNKCPKVSCMVNSNCDGDNRQQVWGFCLWKSKFESKNENAPSKWSMYQSWCNLPQADRNAWISAGVSIQFASKFANSKVMEMRPTKAAKQSIVQKITNPIPPPLELIDSNKENSSIFSIDSTGNIIKKGFTPAKPIKLNDVRITPTTKITPAATSDSITNSPNSALRSSKLGPKKEEFVVEKIMAKRFNPRRKTWEYNIKWENFGHDSNTWEPMTNLSHCKKLLDQFEEQLRRMKEEKAKSEVVLPKIRGRPAKEAKANNSASFSPPKISNVVGGVSEDYGGSSSGRPQRHCKQKALNQVKQWCDNNSDDDEDYGKKRKYDMDDDSDDDFEGKRIKLEPESDESDDLPIKPKVQVKKVSTPRPIAPAKTVKNGNTSLPQQMIPSNILIPDANGVVRINQKQLPSLKSGVYIMSKTAGIIKLDSNSSRMATSGGQTVVKVLPKIGQSQVKVINSDGKKEIIGQSSGSATPIRIPAANTVKASTPRLTPKLRRDIKKIETPNIAPKITIKKVAEATPKKPVEDEESDDGLEPLPFPAPDEPIPALEEEEKNDDFVLDPETGKIAGVEYVDKPVVIKKEPQAEPATTTELENIVKIAAADLSDDEFDDGNDSDDSTLKIKEETPTKVTPPTKSESVEKTVVETSTPGIRKIVKYTVSGPSTQTPTLLNKSIVQGKPKPLARPQTQAVRQPQRIINQMVTQPRPNQQPQIKTVVRHVIEPARPGSTTIRKTMAPMQINRPRNSLGSKPMASPLQPTRTYSAMGGIRQTNPGNRVQLYGTKTVGGAPALKKVGNQIIRASPSPNVIRQQPPQQTLTQKPQMTRIVQRVVSPQKRPVMPQQQQQIVTQIQNKPMTTPVKSKTVINMPSLMEEDTPLSPPPKPQPKPTPQRVLQPKPSPVTQPKPVAQQKPVLPKPVAPPQPKPVVQQPKPAPAAAQQKSLAVKEELKIEEAPANEPPQLEALDSATDQTDWSSFTMMSEGENPVYVTGDDGTIYQVAGQNEEGQTILLTQGPDGQQQCLLVTNEISEMTGEQEPQPSTSTANLTAETGVEVGEAMAVDQSLQTPLEIKTDDANVMEGMGVNDQVVAQVIQAEPVSPGGTHKVVVLLPDGNLMVTQVTPEEYANLEIEV